jgi:2-polyprenyl-6-methoxyphenol hydroxylase-like FAD-dependent oxidoreductase
MLISSPRANLDMFSAGLAMEDAVSLAVLMPLGISPNEIPERLELYQKVRDERAHRIQEVSRITGANLDDPISKSLDSE